MADEPMGLQQATPNYAHSNPYSGGGRPPYTPYSYQSGYGSGYGAGPVVSSGSNMSADDTLAEVYRSEWNDYMRLYPEWDRRLVDLATGTEDNEEAISRARGLADSSFDSSAGTYERNLRRFGMNETPEAKADRERRESRNRLASRATAGNQVRQHTEDRDTQLLAGNLAVGLQNSNFMGE